MARGLRHLRPLQPFRPSGSIWRRSARSRRTCVRSVCARLVKEYGVPRLGNPRDPLDDLIFVVLSNRTSAAGATRAFRQLKERFSAWDKAIESPPSVLRRILKPIGLSTVRSNQIRAALRQIVNDFGRCDLSGLRKKRRNAAEAYLTSLPGVSLKVAKCVSMYTLDAKVLPVDAHVHRIAGRLGWISRKRADQCHKELEAIVPPALRYAFHVDCIAHGRAICRAKRPACESCCIRQYCRYFMDGKRG